MPQRKTIGIGERLTYWRERRGITQMELAARLDLNPSSVCRWEKGTSNPTAENLEEIARVLRITLADFFGQMETAKAS